MAYVITRLCRDCVDGSCVDVCPTDAILEHRPEAGTSALPRQLFINPGDCIGCRLCEPECPWEAIFDEDDVPAPFRSDIELNALSAARREEFHVPVERLRRGASASEVLANRLRWERIDPEPSVASAQTA
jgi:ferredoxin